MALKLKNIDIINPPIIPLLKNHLSVQDWDSIVWKYGVLQGKGGQIIQSPFSLKSVYPLGGTKIGVQTTPLLVGKDEPFSIWENRNRWVKLILNAFKAMDKATGYGVFYTRDTGHGAHIYDDIRAYFGLSQADINHLDYSPARVLLDGISEEQAQVLALGPLSHNKNYTLTVFHSYPFNYTEKNYYAAGMAPIPAMQEWVKENYDKLPSTITMVSDATVESGLADQQQDLGNLGISYGKTAKSMIPFSDAAYTTPLQQKADEAAANYLQNLGKVATTLVNSVSAEKVEGFKEAVDGINAALSKMGEGKTKGKLKVTKVSDGEPKALKDATLLTQQVKGTACYDYRVVALGGNVNIAARLKSTQVSIRAEWKTPLSSQEEQALKNILVFQGEYASLHLATKDAESGESISPYRILGAVLWDLCSHLSIKYAVVSSHSLKEFFPDVH